MMNQLLKNSYIWLLEKISHLVDQRVVEGKVAYVMTFPENNDQLIHLLMREPSFKSIHVFYTKQTQKEAMALEKQGLTIIKINSFRFFISGIKQLLQSQFILIDNYIAFLAGLSLTDETIVYQLWHANGAIKRFGWEDVKTLDRSEKDKERFQQVYDTADYYVVASDNMANVFEKSYHQPVSKMLKIGLPRVDRYFDAHQKQQDNERFEMFYPVALNKKVVLYAPTYRQEQQQPIDWEQVLPDFPQDEYYVIVKFHPHMTFDDTRSDNRHYLSEDSKMKLRELLSHVDILVTDYSSIPFEYQLANQKGKTVFYCPDYEEYQANVGIQTDFFTTLNTVSEVVTDYHVLLDNANENTCFSKWNSYNDGQASQRLVKHMKQVMGKSRSK